MLNNLWVHEWREMAAVATEGDANIVDESEGEVDIVENESLSDPNSNQPRFFLKKDVGDAHCKGFLYSSRGQGRHRIFC